MKALSLHITGIVQGVGFRPFVYSLATRLELTGWVLNSSEGVLAVVEGSEAAVDDFARRVRTDAPPMALVESVVAQEVEPEGFDGFEIRPSLTTPGAMTLVSPDIATCAACEQELADPCDRRHAYPFINCTNCGPRFTILSDVPYDRPLTTMRDFSMCPECAREYADPADRRFHAQPDACFVCGPRLYFNVAEPAFRAPNDAGGPAAGNPAAGGPAAGNPAEEPIRPPAPGWPWSPESDAVPRPHRDRDAESARSAEILDAAAALLRGGGILASKGLGGFHLACDATNESAVKRLRERKNRPGKPLAIMVPDLEAARAYCDIDDTEAALLTGTARPIVLLRRASAAQRVEGPARSSAGGEASEDCLSTGALRTPAPEPAGDLRTPAPEPAGARSGALAPSIAGDLPEIGVMLPYTPLHHLLLARIGGPLVMTSGNVSEEPIATGNAEALFRLSRIADAFLMHDRDIHSRYDDSVVRVVDGGIEPVRRARGYAPHPITMPFASDIDILAVGPEQKNTFTLLTGDKAFVSQHIGDMENADTLEHYEQTIALYRRLFRIDPQLVAHDLHPEYLPTKYAHELALPLIGVQHHHAHIVSVTAENSFSGPVVGVAFDGTGYGDDGHIWGGEVLFGDWAGYERFAHLEYVPMPGGTAAVRRPARMALGTLLALGLDDHPGAAPLRARLAEGEEALLRTMVSRQVNSPLTSSMGRLFDTVAALTGIRDDTAYEGEAAIELEAAADPIAVGSYEFGLTGGETGEPLRILIAPMLACVLDDIEAGMSASAISTRFHRAVVRVIVSLGLLAAEKTGTRDVALAGGVFLNRLVFGNAVADLSSAGLNVMTHRELPVNDGAISLGQAVVAWARHREV